jgi:hypothetical protein
VRFVYSPDDGREEPPGPTRLGPTDSLKLKTTQWSYFFREGMREEPGERPRNAAKAFTLRM